MAGPDEDLRAAGGAAAQSHRWTVETLGMRLHEARHQYVRWLAVTRDLSPHTIRAYDGDLAALERHLGSEAAVAVLDRDGVTSFLEELQAAGLAPATIKRRAAGVRGFCRWLLAIGGLAVDPWSGMVLSIGRSRRLPRVVSGADLERLVRATRTTAGVSPKRTQREELPNPHETTTLLAIALMVATGVRVNELVNIACDDIDLPSRSVRVLGKGRRERQVFLTNDWIAELVEAYLTTRMSLGIAHDRLFFNRRGAPLSAASVRSRLSRAATLADVASKVTPHMLRHSAATRLLEAGVDIRIIQRLLGHASLSTTEIYTHVSDQALQRTLADVDVRGGMLAAQ